MRRERHPDSQGIRQYRGATFLSSLKTRLFQSQAKSLIVTLSVVLVVLLTADPSSAQRATASAAGAAMDFPFEGTARVSRGQTASHPNAFDVFGFTDVLAMSDGVIRYRSCTSTSRLEVGFDLWTDEGVQIKYDHLNADLEVRDGERVTKGQLLGTLFPDSFDTSGNRASGTQTHENFPSSQTCGFSSTGAHLHIRISGDNIGASGTDDFDELVVDGIRLRDIVAGASIGSAASASGSGSPATPVTRFNTDARSTLTPVGRAVRLEVCATGLNGQTVNVLFSNGERQSRTGTSARCLTFVSEDSFGTATLARSRAQLNTTPANADLPACATATNFAALCDQVTLAPVPTPPATPGVPVCQFRPALGNFLISWPAVEDADSYELERRIPGPNIETWVLSSRSFVNGDPETPGSLWRVAATNEDGTSRASAWSSPCPQLPAPAEPESPSVTVVVPPTAPIITEAPTAPVITEAPTAPDTPETPTAPATPTPALCNGQVVTVDLAVGDIPTEGPDVIRGTSGDDIVNALGGNDIICGLQGNDVLRGGDGFDKIFAGAGNDTLEGNDGNDLLIGGEGRDSISGGNGNDRIQGGDNNDSLDGGNGEDRIAGGNGNDVISGGRFDDLLFGNLGRDVISGNEGNDVIRGGAWLDTMDGGPGNDGCTLTDPAGLVESRTSCETGVFGR